MFVLTANLSGMTHFTAAQIAVASTQFDSVKQAKGAARFLSRSIGRTVSIAKVEEPTES